MILGKTNISPIPFYNEVSLQNHRKDYAFGQVYPLIVPSNALLPFQVILDEAATFFTEVRLHSHDDAGSYLDITTDMHSTGLNIKTFEGYNLLVYPGNLPIPQALPEGKYYLAIKLNTGTIYSDVFTLVPSTSCFLALEYYNLRNLAMPIGHIDFSENFKFKCYIPSQIGKPEYVFEEEATDRMGYAYIESQISKKVYKFVFIAPEYLCDALRIVRLCSAKTIKENQNVYELSTFSMEPKWEEQGDLASVECEFETDTVITSICGYSALLGGDFNDDFNDDFNKK